PVYDSLGTGVVIRNCRGYSIGGEAVLGNGGTDSVLVDACYFEDGRIGNWTYDAIKSRYEEHATGPNFIGRGCVLRNSTIKGHSNGVSLLGSQADSLKIGGADGDIYKNIIANFVDDGIENDLGQGVNQAIWGNFITGGIHGFSPVPMFTGPVYVV